MKHPVVISLFLALTVLIALGCCLGMALMKSPLARLHYVGAASFLAPWFLAFAVLSQEGFSPGGLKSLLVAVFLLCQGPLLVHTLARAIAIRAGLKGEDTSPEQPQRPNSE